MCMSVADYQRHLIEFVSHWKAAYPCKEQWTKRQTAEGIIYADMKYFDVTANLWLQAFIIYNDSYGTPVLWFNAYEPGEGLQKRLPLESAVRTSSEAAKCSEGEHPVFGTGFYYVDPCRINAGTKDMSETANPMLRKILVLDLDETLIHSHHDGVLRPMVRPGTPPDFILKVTIERQPVRFFVHLRPHVDYFLTVVSQWYDLVVFTASMEIYGTVVAERLDKGRGLFARRYFRQHCTMDYSGYTKDLSSLHSDLSSIFILDNSPAAYRNFTSNAIPIKSWFWDPTDTALLNLLPFLDCLRFTSDVRSILSRNPQK